MRTPSNVATLERGRCAAAEGRMCSEETILHWRMPNRWRLILGYKYMNVDYEKGEGVLARKICKVKHSGPEMAVAYSW
jgi:hypothetical protein